MLHIIMAVIGLYVSARGIWPLSLNLTSKIVLTLAVLCVAEHHLITRTWFGSMASPEIPGAVLMLLGWLFCTLLLLGFFILVKDLLGMVTYPVSAETGRLLLASPRLLFAITVVTLVIAAIGVWNAVKVPKVKTVEIELPGLPIAFDGFRIVQLTDLHASRLLQRPWMAAVVDRANALSPDLTVITGDMVDGSPQARADDVKPLQSLTARYGVLAIPGNHEYYSGYQSWLSAFNDLGLHMLTNQHATITHENQQIVVAGITDHAAGRFGLPDPDVAAALEHVPANQTVILLSHRPAGALAHARAGVSLQLSGHTHGGQILGAHVLTKMANDGYVNGLYDVDAMKMYVSMGTGLWNGFPIRLGRPSEITQIVLRTKN
ncbi:MAG TPA: metallophosphoesterase [Advenella sp.]|nr:metallophosphoesterase [Advenella sp.]